LANKRAKEELAQNHYSLAIMAYDSFINEVEASEFEKRAERAKASIENKLSVMSAQLVEEIKKAVRKFDFDKAVMEITKVAMAFSGTSYENKLKRQKAAVSILKRGYMKLGKIVSNPNTKKRSIRVRCYHDGKHKLTIVGVTDKGLEVSLEGGVRTVIDWEEITPKEVIRIYKIYFGKTPEVKKIIKIYVGMFKLNS
jgi:hypothetical protein